MQTIEPSAVILCPEIQNLIRTKARCLIGRAGYRVSDRDDIEQDLTLDLFQRLPKFQPDRGSLDLFVRVLLDRAASRMMRDRRATCRDYRRTRTLAADEERSASAEEKDRYLEALHSEDLRQDVREAIATVPSEYRLLVELLTRDNLTRAAQCLRQPRSTLQGHAARIGALFRRWGLEDY